MSSKASLRGRQKEVLMDMIRGAAPIGVKADGEGLVWKLLVYDARGRDIIAPLIKVKELHDLGVTLHLSITKARHAVPNSPAIYLCEPTQSNIDMIVKDCNSQLYDWYYVNFTSQCPRELLESMAEQLASSSVLESVKHIRVFDQSLGYIADGDDLYNLLIPNSFATINSRHTADANMEAHVDRIVLGLSHVLVSLQMLPVVAFAKNGPSEMIGMKLSSAIGDLHREKVLTATHSPAFGRPLLLVVDRSADLASCVHHPFTYRGLLADALGMQLNRVKVVTGSETKLFDIDPLTDTIFRTLGGREFDQFSTMLQSTVDEYQRDYAAVSNGDGNSDSASAVSEMLVNAPKFRERKSLLDTHISLAHTLLTRIKDLSLDKFHGVEDALLHREGLDAAVFEELLTSTSYSLEDKQRLYLVAYLMCVGVDESAMETINRLLYTVSGDGKQFDALSYLKKLRSWSVGNNNANANATSGWGFAQNLAKNLASTFTSASAKELPLTRLVDSLLGEAPAGRAGAGKQKLLESLGAVDPINSSSFRLDVGGFSQVVVFVVGGGSVTEYDNIKEWESRNPKKSVVYGSSALVNGHSFLQELNSLGNE
jgi:hypothetical protein